ncbi:uncharacterized protein LOC143291759 isoform X2 [Babylonia areolata]|uniref:uncharacterized protein LOC143291759 isoform X2 n=1 Tax=Babylonia areolata TaxID=304850 RepID=UPI003FD3255F
MAMTLEQGVLVTILWLYVAVRTGAEKTDVNSTCSAPPVDVSTTAYVTCHFTTDVTRLRPVSISVEFLPDGALFSEKIAYCDLSERSTSCSEAGPGSRFSLSPVNTAHRDWSMEIPHVKVQDQGQYYCQLLSDKAGHTDFVPCSLAVGNPPITITPGQSGTTSDVTEHLTTMESPGMTELSVTLTPGQDDAEVLEEAWGLEKLLPVIVAPAVAVVLFAVVGGVCLYRRYRKTEGKTDEEDAGTENPEPSKQDPLNPSPQSSPRQNGKLAEVDEEGVERSEDGNDSDERSSLVEVSKDNFEVELKTKAAMMQIPIQRKMSTGEYP